MQSKTIRKLLQWTFILVCTVHACTHSSYSSIYTQRSVQSLLCKGFSSPNLQDAHMLLGFLESSYGYPLRSVTGPVLPSLCGSVCIATLVWGLTSILGEWELGLSQMGRVSSFCGFTVPSNWFSVKNQLQNCPICIMTTCIFLKKIYRGMF